jgi:hypothetical protein
MPHAFVPLFVCRAADGSLGSRTALFHEPYSDQPDTRGTRTIELLQLRELAAGADAAGLQLAVHAIGDRAVDDVAAVYAELASKRSVHSSGGGGNGPASQQRLRRAHRLEHVQHLSGPETARRLAAAGVAVTPNPLHLAADRAIAAARLGTERAGPGRTFAFKTLLQAGVTSGFGSDWPVVPLDALGERAAREGTGCWLARMLDAWHKLVLRLPVMLSKFAVHAASARILLQSGSKDNNIDHRPRFLPSAASLYAAVHRRAPGESSSQAWGLEEALTPEEALAAHTLGGAAVAGLDRELGSISEGKLADFAVLTAAPGVAAARVLRTYVGGRCVHGCENDMLASS